MSILVITLIEIKYWLQLFIVVWSHLFLARTCFEVKGNSPDCTYFFAHSNWWRKLISLAALSVLSFISCSIGADIDYIWYWLHLILIVFDTVCRRLLMSSSWYLLPLILTVASFYWAYKYRGQLNWSQKCHLIYQWMDWGCYWLQHQPVIIDCSWKLFPRTRFKVNGGKVEDG